MSVADKLQIRPGHAVALVGMPDGVELELPAGANEEADPAHADAVVAFVTTSDELTLSAQGALDAAQRDALAWIVYPKGGRLGTDLTRDLLRERLEAEGLQPVRQVAIDDTWSALRFRPL